MKHRQWMQVAIEEAKQAVEHGDIPVGCLIVKGDQVIGRGHNRREIDQDPLAHAEVLAIKEASGKLKSWRLEECILYVTLEPCPMCAGAIIQARIPLVIYGATDPKAGAVESVEKLFDQPAFNHQPKYLSGIMEMECSLLLKEYFQIIRKV